MKHEIEAVLNALEAIITEVDLELWQWKTDLDMLSLAGCGVPVILYKEGDAIGVATVRLFHDDGALAMSAENIITPDHAKVMTWRGTRLNDAKPYFNEPMSPLPLVMHKDGKKITIGTAEFKEMSNGDIVALGSVTEYVPELTDNILDKLSLSTPIPPLDLNIPGVEFPREQFDSFLEGFNFDIDSNTSVFKIEGQVYKHRVDLETHPFFEENDDNGS